MKPSNNTNNCNDNISITTNENIDNIINTSSASAELISFSSSPFLNSGGIADEIADSVNFCESVTGGSCGSVSSESSESAIGTPPSESEMIVAEKLLSQCDLSAGCSDGDTSDDCYNREESDRDALDLSYRELFY